ncbi:hypothetical protein Rwratislav_04483, partial [Rhodococcus wratislaviensis IFP 2016]
MGCLFSIDTDAHAYLLGSFLSSTASAASNDALSWR